MVGIISQSYCVALPTEGIIPTCLTTAEMEAKIWLCVMEYYKCVDSSCWAHTLSGQASQEA